jgi:hypothetical protein
MLSKEDLKKLVSRENIIPCPELAKRFKNLVKDIIKEEEISNYPFPAGYDSYLKQNRIYSLLANQVVGAEKPY